MLTKSKDVEFEAGELCVVRVTLTGQYLWGRVFSKAYLGSEHVEARSLGPLRFEPNTGKPLYLSEEDYVGSWGTVFPYAPAVPMMALLVSLHNDRVACSGELAERTKENTLLWKVLEKLRIPTEAAGVKRNPE